jgi:hypothetical protein
LEEPAVSMFKIEEKAECGNNDLVSGKGRTECTTLSKPIGVRRTD